LTSKKKILVIDDESDMIIWMTTFLEDNGFDTIFANDGIEGFQKAKSEQPDLITLDVAMEKQSGVKTLRQLQEEQITRDIPVIMITGVSTELKRFLDRNKKVDFPRAFLEKPVDRDEFLSKIKELIG